MVGSQCRPKANSGGGLWTAAKGLFVSHQDGYEIDLDENKSIQPTIEHGGYHERRDGTWDWESTPLSHNDTRGYHHADADADGEPGSLTFHADGQVVRSYTGNDVRNQPIDTAGGVNPSHLGSVTIAISTDAFVGSTATPATTQQRRPPPSSAKSRSRTLEPMSYLDVFESRRIGHVSRFGLLDPREVVYPS